MTVTLGLAAAFRKLVRKFAGHATISVRIDSASNLDRAERTGGVAGRESAVTIVLETATLVFPFLWYTLVWILFAKLLAYFLGFFLCLADSSDSLRTRSAGRYGVNDLVARALVIPDGRAVLAFVISDVGALSEVITGLVCVALKAAFLRIIKSRTGLRTVGRLLAPARRIDRNRLALSARIAVTIRAVIAAIAVPALLAARAHFAVGLQVVVTKRGASGPGWTLAAETVNARTRAGSRAKRTTSGSTAVCGLLCYSTFAGGSLLASPVPTGITGRDWIVRIAIPATAAAIELFTAGARRHLSTPVADTGPASWTLGRRMTAAPLRSGYCRWRFGDIPIPVLIPNTKRGVRVANSIIYPTCAQKVISPI